MALQLKMVSYIGLTVPPDMQDLSFADYARQLVAMGRSIGGDGHELPDATFDYQAGQNGCQLLKVEFADGTVYLEQ